MTVSTAVRIEKIREIDLKNFGEISIWPGDVNGDGKVELVIPQTSDAPVRKASAGGYPHEKTVHCITAIDLDGNILWQRGTPIGADDRKHHGPGAFLVHDLNADGQAEIAYATQADNLQMVRLLRGCDGELQAERETGATYNAMPANLRGLESKRDFVIGTGLSLVFAYDENLEPIWEWAFHYGGGHEHAACDVEGKGVDDLFIGVSRLNARGRRIWWRPDLDDALEGMSRCPHIDHVEVRQLFDGRDDYQVLWFGGRDIVCLDAITGELVWRHRGKHLQEGSIGRFVPGSTEQQIIVWEKELNTSLALDAHGNCLWTKPLGRSRVMRSAGPDGCDLLVVVRPIAGGAPFISDLYGNRLADLPLPVSAEGPGDRGFGWYMRTLDIDDDGRDELLAYNRHALHMFKIHI
jgi:outer membrane protein assembly factor BamB